MPAFFFLRREFFILVAATLLTGVVVPAGTASDSDVAANPLPPNFLFLLVDDLGWADTGAYGSVFHQTPCIDALAASGMKFTQGYAAGSVCSPTRASIMTGRHPVRVDITDWIPGANARPDSNPRFRHVEDRDNLALDEVTIAEALRHHGYQTFFAGKWHLGGDGHLPTDQGFDINIGGFNRGSPPGGYYAPWNNPYLEAGEEGEYLTERLTSETIDFMTDRDPGRPFLVFLSYYNVHTPIQPWRREIDRYRQLKETLFGETTIAPIPERDGLSRARQDNPDYASMVAAVDASVGKLTAALRNHEIDDNTVVIFFSDNGGLCTLRRPGPTTNLPLRSGKGWLYEGGIREPMIIRAPGVTRPNTVCDHPVVSTDFYPTILELAGLPMDPERHADGTSLVPLLRGASGLPPRDLHWHYPHYHGSTWKPGAAIRSGNWKLIEFYEYREFELYDLSADVGETTNLANEFPGIAADLRSRLARWQQSMGAKMPEPARLPWEDQ